MSSFNTNLTRTNTNTNLTRTNTNTILTRTNTNTILTHTNTNSTIPHTNTNSTIPHTNTRQPIEPKEHVHSMVYYVSINNGCNIINMYTCADEECGHWEESRTHNSANCDMQVTKYSTHVTCYECINCGRKESSN